MQTICATVHITREPGNGAFFKPKSRAHVSVTMPDGKFWRSLGVQQRDEDLTDAQEARMFIEDFLIKNEKSLKGKLHGSQIAYAFHTPDGVGAVFSFRLDCDDL